MRGLFRRPPAPGGRHELKHAITQMDCTLLRTNLRHVMQPDPHAGADGSYRIRSVYFDNFDNKVLTEKKEGFYRRDKYRVRLYNLDTAHLTLEKKSKRDNMTYKSKCPVTALEYERIRLGDTAWMETDERELVRELQVRMKQLQLKPTVIVDYTREVFVYPHGNVRVTLDSDIRTGLRHDDVCNAHVPMTPVLGPGEAILEVKYDAYLPDHIRALLQIGARTREAFSKYQLSRMYG
ncbi:polyphosphate polymerase domain-containing protein [Paenibacillus sp. IB182496]|uniref:Polyphosphate polymerase domain-containing protein n=1 Tax=Paenibacillus sabuli TaxID=2772509 RepID=A0A927BWY5_9BACL|nr:polyphosphate polymerase domain-containing protein [Paenibacillus sabuli]MBD2846863.1 polyphosphate polymerase domain-containing protein [Paenibacillus sabuli]